MRYADAPSLLPLGLEPIPIKPGEKVPAMTGWTTAILSPENVATLAGRFPDCGIAARLNNPVGGLGRAAALDADIRDEEAAEQFRVLLDMILEPGSVRYGAKPKFLRLLVLATERPLQKRVSRRYRDFLGHEHQVELLAHKCMLYGLHPSGVEYEWTGPLDLGPARDPAIIDEIFDAFDALARHLGWELVAEAAATRPAVEDPLESYAPPIDITTEELREALASLDPECGYDEWLRIGMALHHQYSGADEGFELWDDWSATGASYPGQEALRGKWLGFHCLGARRPVTARSIVRKAVFRRPPRQPRRIPPAEILPGLDRKVGRNGAPGAIEASFLNTERIVCQDDSLPELWYNELQAAPFYGDRRLVTTDALHLKRYIAQTYHFEPATATCYEAFELSAQDNKRHPVREYLGELRWDGAARLDTWLIRYLGAADTPLNREIGRKTLCAAVTRSFEPGAKWDFILILEGPQGCGKSSAVHALVPDPTWVADLEVSRDERRMQEIIRVAFLIEFGELRGLGAADTRLVKAFLSRTHDTYRGAYERYASDYPRQCIFIGTTNDSAYLQDETGNRRFIPVKIGQVDLEALRADRDQLWAEAVLAYHEGEILHWSAEAHPALAVEQERRVDVDIWEQTLRDYLADKDRVIPKVMILEALGVPESQVDRGMQRRVLAIVRRLGWTNDQFHVTGRGTVHGYVKVKTGDA